MGGSIMLDKSSTSAELDAEVSFCVSFILYEITSVTIPQKRLPADPKSYSIPRFTLQFTVTRHSKLTDQTCKHVQSGQ